MAEHLKLSVILDGKQLQSVGSLNLNQGIFSHHHFEVQLPLSSLVSFANKEEPLPALKNCIGRIIDITIGTATDADRDGRQDQSVFKGIVTNVNVLGQRWEHALVNITGSSPTVLMDGITDSKAYSQKGIKQIYEDCVGKHLASEITMEDNLTHTDNLMYTVQYNESDFDFIKRLCFQYGEWCYYNGSTLCLGLKPNEKIVTLSKNRILSLSYNYSLAPSLANVNFRNYKKHEVEQLKPKKAKLQDDMASHSISESLNVFPGAESSNIYLPSSLSGDGLQNEKNQIQHQLNALQSSAMANVLVIDCQSDVAGIAVGSTVKLDKLHHSGEFIVTNITHSCYDARSYSNHFIAIPKDALFPAGIDVKFPQMRECPAIVIDNKDPEKLGRVKVLFDWSTDVASPWLRMITPHAGDNRGFFFVPEEGDEVMVGFEMGNPDYPYILGSLYNGKNNFGKRARDKNNLKSIKTRSGNEILFDDGGQITIKNQHNSIQLKCAEDGTILIQTDGNMEFIAGKNMAVNVGEELTINVGKTMTMNVMEDVALVTEGEYALSASKDIAFSSMTNVTATAMQNLELKSNINAELSSLKTVVNGDQNLDLKSSIVTNVKGGIVKIN